MSNNDDIIDRAVDRFFHRFTLRQVFLHMACMLALLFMFFGTSTIFFEGKISGRTTGHAVGGLLASLVILFASLGFSLLTRLLGNNKRSELNVDGERKGIFFVVGYLLVFCTFLCMNVTSAMRTDGIWFAASVLSGFGLFYVVFLTVYLVHKIKLISDLKKMDVSEVPATPESDQ